MPQRVGSYFHLHLVSDATGETLTTVARAATAQYAKVSPVEHVYPLVRTQKQLDRVLTEIEQSPGIVLYTLLDDELTHRLENHCRELGLPCLSILGPVLGLLHSYLGTETSHRVGAQHVLNAEYFKRIDALNYSMLHDDGQHIDGLEELMLFWLGYRASKTPTSIYLANRGVKTGNVPLVPGVAVPPNVEDLERPLVVGLYASPERIVQISTEPAARPESASGRCALRRSQIGGGGDRILQKTMRSPQLAQHRCHSALHRGDRGGRDEFAGGETPTAGRVSDGSLAWCRQAGARLQSESRHAILVAAGIPHEVEPAHLDERQIEERAESNDAARWRRCLRAKRLSRSPAAAPVGWFWEPTRPWQSGHARSRNHAIERPHASNLCACGAARMSSIRRSRLCATV